MTYQIKNGDRLLNKTVMKIISQDVDFRGWVTFNVQSKRTDEELTQEFQEMYPQNDVAVQTLFNLDNTYQVTLLPKDKLF